MRSRFEIYCDILYTGLANIRDHAADKARCFAEADHLHNIPELLRNFEREELHRYYWEAMRPSFISVSKQEWLARFDQLWRELDTANKQEWGVP
jgi:hypothetical protein